MIGLADTFGKAYFPSLALFLIYLAMAFVLLIRPQGLFGIKYTGISAAPAKDFKMKIQEDRFVLTTGEPVVGLEKTPTSVPA